MDSFDTIIKTCVDKMKKVDGTKTVDKIKTAGKTQPLPATQAEAKAIWQAAALQHGPRSEDAINAYYNYLLLGVAVKKEEKEGYNVIQPSEASDYIYSEQDGDWEVL